MKILKTSPSDLETYANCPYCWLLKAKGKRQAPTAAMLFGSRLHKAVENYHKEVYPETPEEMQKYIDEYENLYTQDYQVVEDFWSLPLLDTDITFNMKVDLVKDDFLIEHKTSARPYSQSFVDVHRQITAYSWAWRMLYTEPEQGIKVNVFLTNPKPEDDLIQVLETERTQDHYDEWSEWVKGVLSGIENDEFEPNEHGKYHNFPECPFYKDE